VKEKCRNGSIHRLPKDRHDETVSQGGMYIKQLGAEMSHQPESVLSSKDLWIPT
jgi:hypothetical protein